MLVGGPPEDILFDNNDNIRNIFVFTLALSDLLLTASVPFTVLDALTQVQVLMFNKCNTMFSKYVDLFITSQGVRKVPKYSSRRSSFSSFFHPTGMASSQFAFSVQVFLIVIHSCSHVDKGLSIMAKTITSTVP